MKGYLIKSIDKEDKKSLAQINDLINEVFKTNFEIEKLPLNTSTRNKKTIFFGAYYNNDLVAFNAFISHELLYNSNTVIAYQSCWSATSNKHRKKGLFSMLINHAKENLDGAFIFGFPNGNSSPIFLKKLGFRKIALCKVNIPVRYFPTLSLMYFLKKVDKTYLLPIKNCFLTIESELIELKKNEYPDQVKIYSSYNNIVWGKVNKRKYKIGNLTFFSVGGIQINKPHLLHLVFKEIAKKEKLDFIQIISSNNNSMLELFRGVQPASLTEPLIIFDLNKNTNDSHFNLTTGIKDVF